MLTLIRQREVARHQIVFQAKPAGLIEAMKKMPVPFFVMQSRLDDFKFFLDRTAAFLKLERL